MPFLPLQVNPIGLTARFAAAPTSAYLRLGLIFRWKVYIFRSARIPFSLQRTQYLAEPVNRLETDRASRVARKGKNGRGSIRPGRILQQPHAERLNLPGDRTLPGSVDPLADYARGQQDEVPRCRHVD